MSKLKKHKLPPCYVVVRRLTLREISRMVVNPLFTSRKCGFCKRFVHHGPNCSTCLLTYHYNCALLCRTCCELPILNEENVSSVPCQKCRKIVLFGPSCSVCHSRFHSACLSPYSQCCQRNLFDPCQHQCVRCQKTVTFGPRCPFCNSMYHAECVGDVLECCGFKIPCDEQMDKCGKCFGNIKLGSPMCQLCGEFYHNKCRKSLECCNKPVSLEVFYVPSFQFMKTHFARFKQKAKLSKPKEIALNHTPTLRNRINSPQIEERVKKKTTNSQDNGLDDIIIVNVKTELEEKEVQIPSSPIVVQEMHISETPHNEHEDESHVDGDNSLKSFFDFIYQTVKNFPPQLQAQVKVELFKTVTEAEVKLQCNDS